MRSTQTMTVSLPPEMVRDVERVRKAEHRTRSELVREALRTYFDRAAFEARVRSLPVYTPTPAERRAIAKGRAAMRRGEYYTLDEFFRSLDRARAQARREGRGARARA